MRVARRLARYGLIPALNRGPCPPRYFLPRAEIPRIVDGTHLVRVESGIGRASRVLLSTGEVVFLRIDAMLTPTVTEAAP